MPMSHVEVPGSKSEFLIWSNSLLMCNLRGSTWCLRYLDPCHPLIWVRNLSYRLLPLPGSSLAVTSLRSEPVMGDLSLSVFCMCVCLWLSYKRKNKEVNQMSIGMCTTLTPCLPAGLLRPTVFRRTELEIGGQSCGRLLMHNPRNTSFMKTSPPIWQGKFWF